MRLYGDIFFVYNLIMDYIVLKMTALIWRTGTRGLFARCLAAVALYTAAVFIWGIYWFLPWAALAAALLFALRPKRLTEFAGMLVTAYLLTFLLGSIGLGLMTVFGADAFAAAIPAVLLLIVLERIDKNTALGKITGLYRISLTAGKKEVQLTAFADSGNNLEIDGSPVLIADRAALLPILEDVGELARAQCKTVAGTAELEYFYIDAAMYNKTERICAAISNTPISGDFNALISTKTVNLFVNKKKSR